MNYFYYTTAFFTLLILAYCIRSLKWSQLKIMWHNAKVDVAAKETREKAQKKGQKPFYFENGKVVVYAKTQLQAMLRYKKSQLRHSVTARRSFKKE